MNRRAFLLSGTSLVVSSRTLPWTRSDKAAAPIALTIHPKVHQKAIPVSFKGLSYEAQQLASPGFFSARNTSLVALCRRLGPGGVLRIGGSTSEHIGWSTENPSESSPNYDSSYGPEDAMHHLYRGAVTPVAIKNLAGFLEETNWKIIYGLSLKNRTVDHSVEEAFAVVETIGPRLIALQLGNEPDLFSTDKKRWTYDYYYGQWEQLKKTICQLHPNAPFAGPDIAHGVEWVAPFASQAGKQIKFLTSHYYAEGPPTDPDMNIDRLLREDKQLASNIIAIQKIRRDSGLPYRLAECNSCYHGGKAGVSNTFASALWGANFMFELAQAGFTGLNFHGGGNGYYSPIAGSIHTGLVARPLYYGMLLFSQCEHSCFVANTFETQGLNLTAYTTISKRKELCVAIINRELDRPAQVQLDAGQAVSTAHGLRLVAPSVDSTTGVTFGGSHVSANGLWKPTRNEPLRRKEGKFALNVPATSAVLVTLT